MKRLTEALTHSYYGDYVQLTASGLNKKNIKKGDYSYYENKNRDHSNYKKYYKQNNIQGDHYNYKQGEHSYQ